MPWPKARKKEKNATPKAMSFTSTAAWILRAHGRNEETEAETSDDIQEDPRGGGDTWIHQMQKTAAKNGDRPTCPDDPTVIPILTRHWSQYLLSSLLARLKRVRKEMRC
jgi:hypothetical protein